MKILSNLYCFTFTSRHFCLHWHYFIYDKTERFNCLLGKSQWFEMKNRLFIRTYNNTSHGTYISSNSACGLRRCPLWDMSFTLYRRHGGDSYGGRSSVCLSADCPVLHPFTGPWLERIFPYVNPTMRDYREKRRPGCAFCDNHLIAFNEIIACVMYCRLGVSTL